MEGMKNHRRVHTNQTPYPCQFCEESFRTLDMLKNHSKTHQEGYKSQRGRKSGFKGLKNDYNIIYDYSEVEEVAESVQQIIQHDQNSD